MSCRRGDKARLDDHRVDRLRVRDQRYARAAALAAHAAKAGCDAVCCVPPFFYRRNDAEIVELHHSLKRDAPSGTALHLAEAVAAGQAVDLQKNMVLERAGDTGARPEHAIGIQTLRGGDNTGEHTVMFIGRGERLEFIHRSSTRAHFAAGAARAASWLVGKPAGLYPIEQVLGLE